MSGHEADDRLAGSAEPAVERIHPPDWLMRLVNPVVRRLVGRGVPGWLADRVLVLHFTGRTSGRHYHVPVGYRRIRGRVTVLSSSPWRVNFRGGRDIAVTFHGQRRSARASLTEDPDAMALLYRQLIDEGGLEDAGRQLGLRINVDRPPTHEELRAMIERSGLAAIWIDLGPRGPGGT